MDIYIGTVELENCQISEERQRWLTNNDVYSGSIISKNGKTLISDCFKVARGNKNIKLDIILFVEQVGHNCFVYQRKYVMK